MHYIHYMAQTINTNRDKGYIHTDDLFYEQAEHETGSSQQHSEGVLAEFGRMREFTLPMEVSGTTPHVERGNLTAHRVSII